MIIACRHGSTALSAVLLVREAPPIFSKASRVAAIYVYNILNTCLAFAKAKKKPLFCRTKNLTVRTNGTPDNPLTGVVPSNTMLSLVRSLLQQCTPLPKCFHLLAPGLRASIHCNIYPIRFLTTIPSLHYPTQKPQWFPYLFSALPGSSCTHNAVAPSASAHSHPENGLMSTLKGYAHSDVQLAIVRHLGRAIATVHNNLTPDHSKTDCRFAQFPTTDAIITKNTKKWVCYSMLMCAAVQERIAM